MREWLLRFLRVPPRPALPAAEAEPVRVFRAAPGWLTYRRIRWALTQAGALAGLLFGLYWLNAVPDVLWPRLFGPSQSGERLARTLLYLIEAGAWVGYAFQAVGSLLLLRLDWDQRWYIVSDRSLRVREGLIRLHEKTTTFENIQNVTIRQGPMQRLLGIADLEVRSAGGGGGKEDEMTLREDLHTVWFRGVVDAPAIRDTILRRVQAAREARAPEAASPPADPVARLAAAADALRAEAHALGAATTLRPTPAAPPEGG